MSLELEIHAIAYEEGGVWLAQGIEYDILARADTIDQLPHAFSLAVAKTLAICEELGVGHFGSIKPAPSKFRALFERAKSKISPVSPVRVGHTATQMDIRLAPAT